MCIGFVPSSTVLRYAQDMSPLCTRALFVASAHSNIFVHVAPKILCGSCPNSSPPSADDSVWHKATKAKQPARTERQHDTYVILAGVRSGGFAFYLKAKAFKCICATKGCKPKALQPWKYSCSTRGGGIGHESLGLLRRTARKSPSALDPDSAVVRSAHDMLPSFDSRREQRRLLAHRAQYSSRCSSYCARGGNRTRIPYGTPF